MNIGRIDDKIAEEHRNRGSPTNNGKDPSYVRESKSKKSININI